MYVTAGMGLGNIFFKCLPIKTEIFLSSGATVSFLGAFWSHASQEFFLIGTLCCNLGALKYIYIYCTRKKYYFDFFKEKYYYNFSCKVSFHKEKFGQPQGTVKLFPYLIDRR